MPSESRDRGRSRTRLEDAGRRIDQKLEDVERRVETELHDIITYLDNDVVPHVRRHSTRTLRILSDKLIRLADYMDKHKP